MLAVLVAVAGCATGSQGEPGDPIDGAPRPDAPPRPDAGDPDDHPDARLVVDADVADGPEPDEPDAAAIDAAVLAVDARVDAAVPVDARVDAAVPVDARVDAAVPVDAALPPDAGTTTTVVFASGESALYRIDPTTLAATLVGNFGWPASVGADAMADIAVAPDGRIVGVSSTRLYRCDPATAVCTLKASLARSFNALGYVPAGVFDPLVEVLVGATADGTLYRVDADTGATTQLGHFSASHSSSGDLAYVGTTLVASVNPGGPTDVAARVATATGATTAIGAGTGESWVWGLAAAGNRLIGFTLSRDIVTINVTTGVATRVTTGPIAWYGAASR